MSEEKWHGRIAPFYKEIHQSVEFDEKKQKVFGLLADQMMLYVD